MRKRAESWLTDMDGVLIREEHALSGAAEFLQRLVDRDRRFLVLTNNSIFTPRDLVARLAQTGLKVPEGEIWTSGLATATFLADQQPNIVHILEVCRKDFVDKNPEVVKNYVRDLTTGMRKALADRPETLKVVNEVIKAPVEVLDTYLLKPNDFAREPGAAPNFAGIQAMFDIYAETGMIKQKLDVAGFRHPNLAAPLD